MRLMDTAHGVTGPINLGNPSKITIKTLAETVVETTGSKSRIEYRPLPTDDPKQRQPDITRAQSQLDWRPLTPLRAGLKKTIEYFDALLSDGVVQLKKPA
jgi:UDP-glucuronate decarboxylase